ncbi:SET domain-containing 4-like protein [Cladobotryum mycophilum]|uniref:SET domain-containing 4-like protein n=1 Tax=Cladobotryum mycophilum TaxID=491253 RepID=A0ABR0T0S6_9HYPO
MAFSTENTGKEELLRWAKDKGVLWNGISLTEIPGGGIGVVAQSKLEEEETILTVPIDTIRSLHTVPKDISQRLPRDMSIHGLLAADLALDKSSELAPWKKVLPNLETFEAGTPFMWHKELQHLLPKVAGDLVNKQQQRFQREWGSISAAFPELSREQFLHAWFVINTRTFYYETPEMEKYPEDDRLALLPVADLFNHADTGCKVSFSEEGYEIYTDRAYEPGEEVYISYGSHSNDFLLAEYGFVLAANEWDRVCLDEVILPRLDDNQKAQLEERKVLAHFVLNDDQSVCDNTRMVLSLLCSTEAQWWTYLDAGHDDLSDRQREVDTLLTHLLEAFLDVTIKTLEKIGKLRVGGEVQRELARRRWEQIHAMVGKTIEHLQVQPYDTVMETGNSL